MSKTFGTVTAVVVFADGQRYSVGDTKDEFRLGGVCKVLLYALVHEQLGDKVTEISLLLTPSPLHPLTQKKGVLLTIQPLMCCFPEQLMDYAGVEPYYSAPGSVDSQTYAFEKMAQPINPMV